MRGRFLPSVNSRVENLARRLGSADVPGMREFFLLPLIAVGTAVGAVIMIPVLLVLAPILAYYEREGTLRLGGVNRDRHLADLDHNLFRGDA